MPQPGVGPGVGPVLPGQQSKDGAELVRPQSGVGELDTDQADHGGGQSEGRDGGEVQPTDVQLPGKQSVSHNSGMS